MHRGLKISKALKALDKVEHIYSFVLGHSVEEMADRLQLAQSPYFSIVSGNCFFSLWHVYPSSCNEYALSTLHTLVTYC